MQILFSSSDNEYESVTLSPYETVCEKAIQPWLHSPQKNCTKQGKTITCYGGIANLPKMGIKQLEGCRELNITCYLNETFNPQDSVQYLPNVERLLIEYSFLTHIGRDFPRMSIEVILKSILFFCIA